MSSLNYLTILGRQPELGLVELESILGSEKLEIFGRTAVVTTELVDINRLGGVLKTAQILFRGPVTALNALPIELGNLPRSASKMPFGISAYGRRESPKMLLAAGLHLKKLLRERGSVRLVTPASGLALSAAELLHNKVLEQGFELLIAVAGDQMVVAQTLGVQDIDWYSKRDYQRPARSAKVGMLPPKLAQILVNSTRSGMVCDPFCGTGVILQEALLMGRAATGSDLAPEMVAATQTNLEWLGAQVAAPLPAWSADLADSRQVVLPTGCAVVSEGFLGPNLAHSPSIAALGPIRHELLALYRESLRNWAKQLTAGVEVSLCVPAWRIGKDWHYLGLVDDLAHLGYTLKSFRTAPAPLLYARDNQVVGRQLLLLRKI